MTAAKEIITEVEGLGGMAKAIESGMPKLRIEESAARKQARIDSGQDTIVGVNKYRLSKEDTIPVLQIDNTAVRAQQIDRLNRVRDRYLLSQWNGACHAAVAVPALASLQVKASRDAAKAHAALEKLRKSSKLTESTGKGSHEYNLLRCAIEAARARCTLGEISQVLREVRGAGFLPPPSNRACNRTPRPPHCARSRGASTSQQRAWCRVHTHPALWRERMRRRWSKSSRTQSRR